LAYSGGLDTSAMVPWLIDRGFEIHAVLVDVGQEEDLDLLCEKAIRYGAASAIVRDARPAMYEHVLPLAIGLAATYEGTYRLGTALARPFIAAEQVMVAKRLGGATLAHGATGKGNDQVRFEFAYRSLAPECPILAPWKVWEFGGRVDLVNYLKGKGFAENYVVQKDFSLDENLWHLSIEGGQLEHPDAVVSVGEVLSFVAGQFAWNNTYGPGPGAVEVTFQNGVPVALNGKTLGLPQIVDQLNHQYRQAPWAWDLIIENRFTGVKSRGLYINPAAKLLQLAADNLARTCLNKPSYDEYCKLGHAYATLMYRGEYFSDQRRIIEAAALAAMKPLGGTVTVQLEPTPHVVKIVNPGSMFTNEMATFERSEYNHADAAGFINLSWLGNIGKHGSEEEYGGLVAAKDGVASDVCAAESVPAGGLVSSSV
jgi:argininosuccinate synthase